MVFSPRYESDFLLDIRSELDFQPTNAFPFDRAKEIGRRDRWTCRDMGRRFQDGWLVDIAHYDHDKSKPWYNSLRNGRVLCRTAHLEEHIRWHLSDGLHRKPVELHAQRNWGYFTNDGVFREGLHTYQVYPRSPELILIDRRETLGLFEKYGLDPQDYFIMDDDNHLPGDHNNVLFFMG